MSLIHEPGTHVGDDLAEALIKEAHERKRRRRLLLGGVTVVVVAGAVGGYLASRSRNSGTTTAEAHVTATTGPVVDARAFAHHGRLAFVSRGTLWVLSGSGQSLHDVRTPGLVPVSPSFSHDGKWLAFVASKEIVGRYGTEVVSSDLWMARADGTDAHLVTAVASNTGTNTTFGWDPHSDVFAVSLGKATTVPFGYATSLELVNPNGSIRTLVTNSHITSAVWEPDGSAMAVSTEIRTTAFNNEAARLATYPVNGTPPTVWIEASSQDADFIVPAGWWPIWGIGYTTVGSGGVPGGSASLDGSPLYTIARPGATPRLLGTTLENESTGAPSVNSAGWLTFVGSSGGRAVWQGKQVMVCSPLTATCSAVAQPAGTVTVDPVWAPTGLTLAYARAPEIPVLTPLPETPSWYNAHELFLYNPKTTSSVEHSETPGVTVPMWSEDGRSLLYVSNNGLWLSATLAHRPTEIARPLFTPNHWPQYYGQVAFSSQFTWWSG